MTDDKDKSYNCECIACGHKMESKDHCDTLKCPKCGAKMRRAERPGPGQGDKTKAISTRIKDFFVGLGEDIAAGFSDARSSFAAQFKIATELKSSIDGIPQGWIPIFSTGKHITASGGGRKHVWTENDLDEIAARYDPITLPAVLAYDLHTPSVDGLGIIYSLKRFGNLLCAQFANVPPGGIEALQSITNRSIEIKEASQWAALATRGIKGPYATKVSFFSGATPAVAGLGQIQILSASAGGGDIYCFDAKMDPINPKNTDEKNTQTKGDDVGDENTITMSVEEAARLRGLEGENTQFKAQLETQAAQARKTAAEKFVADLEAAHKGKFVPGVRSALLSLHMFSARSAETDESIMTFAAEGYTPTENLTPTQAVEGLGENLFAFHTDLTKVFAAESAKTKPGDKDVEDRDAENTDDDKAYAAVVAIAEGEHSGEKYTAAVNKVAEHMSNLPKGTTFNQAALDLQTKIGGK